MHRSRSLRSQISSDWIATKTSRPEQVAHFDEFIYSAQVMQSKESDQLRVDHHQGLSAQIPVARFEEFVYYAHATQPKESNQLRLDRHNGLSTRSPVAHFDEFIYSAEVMQPKE